MALMPVPMGVSPTKPTALPTPEATALTGEKAVPKADFH